MMVYDHSHDKI